MSKELIEFNQKYKKLMDKRKILVKKLRSIYNESKSFEKEVDKLYQESQNTMFYRCKDGYLTYRGGTKSSDKMETLDYYRDFYSYKLWNILHEVY